MLTPGGDQPNYMQAYGPRLRSQGYSIVPIMPGSKAPGRWIAGAWEPMRDWDQHLAHPATEYHVRLWGSYPGCGVGVLTGAPAPGVAGVIAIDIDVLDVDVAAAVRMAVEQALGKTVAVRVGKAPKVLLLYRTVEQFRKMTAKPVEVLALGQQFVAYATHPDTGRPYEWPVEQLVDVPIASLPLVTEAMCREALDDAMQHVPDEMRPLRLAALDGARVGGGAPSDEGLLGTDEAVAAALDAIPNGGLPDWDQWNHIGMAAWAATQGSQAGLVAWDRWSQKNASYDARATAARWTHYHRSPPTRVGAGTLYHIAQQHGWVPPAEIALNPAKATQVDYVALTQRAQEVADRATAVAAPAPPIVVAPEPAAPALPVPVPVQVIEPSLPMGDAASFPVRWLDSPSLVAAVARWIVKSAQRPHPSFALANSLAMFGAIVGRRYRSPYDTRANVMFVAIAPPGGGKDHSRKQVKRLMERAGLHQLIAGDRFTSGVAILKVLSEYPSRLSHMDELGLFLQSIAMKNASPHLRDVIKTLLEVFSSSSGTFHGQEYASAEQQRVDIQAPNFNLFGTTTPQSLIPALSRAMAENGTLSRMLLVPAFEDYPDWQVPTDVAPPDDLVAAVQACWSVGPSGAGNMTNAQHVPSASIELIDVTWGEDVEAALAELRKLETERGRAQRYAWVRATELTIKLAMIEAITRDPVAPRVTLEMIGLAWDLVRWSLSYAERLLDRDVADNETEASHKTVLKLVRAAGPAGISQSELTRATQSLKKRDREDILHALIEAGQIRAEARRHESGPGRPKTVFVAAA